MNHHIFRLHPGQDLKQSILEQCISHNIKAGYVATTVGSLSRVHIRLADGQSVLTMDEHVEIVSLVGTVSQNGVHLHISISDRLGVVRGGHLKEGCIIHTTAEVVLGIIPNATFTRQMDDATGWRELQIELSNTDG